jgi:hypothetical protein
VNKRTKWLLGIGVIATLIVGWQIAAFATLPGSNFEIDTDANLRAGDPTPGTVDWASLAHANIATDPEKRRTDPVNGTGDNAYAGGAKEDDTCPGTKTDSIPPNKSDLLSFHVNQEAASGTNKGFMNLAWSRVSEPEGTTLMDFEFNQKTTPCGAGSPNVVRTGDGAGPLADDLLIEYSLSNGGSVATITARKWTGSAWGTADTLSTPSAVCGGNPCAEGTANQTNIPAAESDGLITSGVKEPRTFGEAQIDLRYVFQSNSCTSFGNAMLKSRSSTAFDSALKDFVTPLNISVANCGEVVIRKETLPLDDPDTSFSYTTLLDRASTDNPSFNLKDGQNQSYTDVIAGDNYTVTETNPALPYVFKDLNCTGTGVPANDPEGFEISGRTVTFDIDPGDKLDCTYRNEKPEGALKIVKNSTKLDGQGQTQLVSQAGTVFSYDNTPGAPPAAVNVTDDNTAAAPDEDATVGEVCVDGLAPGEYTITEVTPPPGYAAGPTPADVTATVVAGTDCDESAGNNNPAAAATVTFTDPPLADIQVNFRDGGSGETFLTTDGTDPGITCKSPAATTLTPTSTTAPTGWTSSKTYEDIAISPSPRTITCTIVIDP